MLSSYALTKKSPVYYDLERKTIGRYPSNSNLLMRGSDNSLYFGIKDNAKTAEVFCQLFKVKHIDDISGLTFSMKCGNENVSVIVNVNYQGQIQIKIPKDGALNRLTNLYSFEKMESIDFTKRIVVIDFLNKEIRFKDPNELIL